MSAAGKRGGRVKTWAVAGIGRKRQSTGRRHSRKERRDAYGYGALERV